MEKAWHDNLADRLTVIEMLLMAPVATTETNPVVVTPIFRPASATHAVFTITGTSQIVLAANPLRRRLVLYNSSDREIYVTFGPTTALGNCTVWLNKSGEPGCVYDGPMGDYTGVVSAACKPGDSGSLQVTEIIT